MSAAVRRSYEARPYPGTARTPRHGHWRIAPWEWIEAMAGRSGEPRRILVAGCGTGSEAFAIRARFPRAEIVAIDYSARSIALARQLQQKRRIDPKIVFQQADLTSKSF